MQKYFISDLEFSSKILTNEVAFQIINVLRGKVKEQFLIGVSGKTYLAEITGIKNKEVEFEIISEKDGNFELPFFVSLFQGYPKADKLENIIKYGTQLGVYDFHPTLMKRSIFKLVENKKNNKLARFNKIAKEAAEQSFRDIVPEVMDIKDLKKIDFSMYDVKLVCYEETAKAKQFTAFKQEVKKLKKGSKIAVVVGPEGGIEEEEIIHLEKQGFIKVGLGPRILRTETVVFYVMSAISYEWELEE